MLRSHKHSGELEASPGGMLGKGSSPGVRCPGSGHLLYICPEFSLEAVVTLGSDALGQAISCTFALSSPWRQW